MKEGMVMSEYDDNPTMMQFLGKDSIDKSCEFGIFADNSVDILLTAPQRT